MLPIKSSNSQNRKIIIVILKILFIIMLRGDSGVN